MTRRTRPAGTAAPPSDSKRERTPLAEEDAAGGTVLLIVDMLGDWQFPEADALLSRALAIAPMIRALKQRCQTAGIPTIYANDNHGRWRSDFRTLVQAGLDAGGRREQIGQLLLPDKEDYFVLKPKQSAFFATPLDLLLSHLQARRLLLTGVAAEQCLLASAFDALMRDYEVICPQDCLASHSQERHDQAMRHLTDVLKVDTRPSTQLDWPP
ncbi:MAG: cysteine hydrolase family protein [Acidobacteriota bacterium]